MQNYQSDFVYEPIDLSDHELGTARKGKYDCPSCGGNKLWVARTNGQKFKCYDGCTASEIRKAVLKSQDSENPAAKERREEKARIAYEQEQERLEKLQTEKQRDRHWRKVIKDGFLTDAHREEMIRRGYEPAWIEAIGATSLPDGRALPIPNYKGYLIGSQLKQDFDKSIGGQVVYSAGQKRWAGRAGTYKLRETHEMPLAVIVPPSPKPEWIAYTESAYDKPFLTAYRWSMATIGSSNIGSNPKDLARTIPHLCERLNFAAPRHVLYPDGGAVANPGVLACYTKLQAQLEALGHELEVAWWGQERKEKNDIDEIGLDTAIEIISWAEYLERSAKLTKGKKDRDAYAKLSDLSMPTSREYCEAYLPTIPMPRPGYITYISSGCGTGKTERLPEIIDNWLRLNPGARVIDIVHRNSIKDGHQRRLGIMEYKVGFGQNESALNSQQKISICLDSLLRLRLEEIGDKPVLIFDELEAILKHMAEAGTLGALAAKIQAHFAKLVDLVLAKGGIVLGLEDSLTDLAIETLNALAPSKQGFELYRNTAERFNWDVQIGSKDLGGFVDLIIERLEAGDRIVLPTSSQAFGEALDRMVDPVAAKAAAEVEVDLDCRVIHEAIAERLPHLKNKIVRLDAKTSPEMHDLLVDPNKWLSLHQPQLLILSPTVESGFSIDAGHFDKRFAYFANLDTRSHIQLLHRERSNIPTYIYCSERGAEAGSEYSKDPQKLLRMWRSIANKTFLMHGFRKGEVTEAEQIWNELAAKFKARSALSGAHSAEYLAADLGARGHRIKPASWSGGKKTYERFQAIKHQIKIEENESFAKCEPIADLHTAIAIIHSSGATYEMRQRAEKRRFLERYSKVNANDPEATWVLYTYQRGAYARCCDLKYRLDKPEIARLLDGQSLSSQTDDPHILYRNVPKNQQQTEMLLPIYNEIQTLASGEYCGNDTPAVKTIADYAVKHSWAFRALFNLDVKPEMEDTMGRKRNRPIETANKILRKLGYDFESRRLGGIKDGSRPREYRAIDPGAKHRRTVEESWDRKYQQLLLEIAEAKQSIPENWDKNLSYNFVVGDLVIAGDKTGTVVLADPQGYLVLRIEDTYTCVLAMNCQLAIEAELTDTRSIAESLEVLASIEDEIEALEGLADLLEVWGSERMRKASLHIKSPIARARLYALVGKSKND